MAEKLKKSRHDEIRDDIVTALRNTFPTKYNIEIEKTFAEGAGRADISLTFQEGGQRLYCEVIDKHPIELLTGPTKKITELVKRMEAKTDTTSFTTIEKVKEAVLEIQASIINSVQVQEKISEQEKQRLVNLSLLVGGELIYYLMYDIMIIIGQSFIEFLYPNDFYRCAYNQNEFRDRWIPLILGESDESVYSHVVDSIPELKQLVENSQKRVRKTVTSYSNLSTKDITFLYNSAMTELEPKSDLKSKYVLMKENSEK